MTTDAGKIRFLAELAGWTFHPMMPYPWRYPDREYQDNPPDYPHSLDAIARDLLPLLREKGRLYALTWYPDSERHEFIIHEPETVPSVVHEGPEPARAAFEAIFEALHGGEE